MNNNCGKLSIRKEKNVTLIILLTVFVSLFGCTGEKGEDRQQKERPNILFAISDDQSYPHASAYGFPEVKTPTFDALAEEGVLFMNAFVAAPQCSPSRAAILTGKNIWQLEEAGTHGSLFPKKFPVFPDALENNGYTIGYTGKAWAPGNWEQSGWSRNPVGPEFNIHQLKDVPFSGIKKVDYVANFKTFLKEKDEERPFFFWYGGHEPHRDYEYESGIKSGKLSNETVLPEFLPDHEIVRNDFLDYLVEIEWFDRKLGEMISHLKEIGEYENTIIVVTSDNGMPFPYAKANLQEYGTHVPLLITGSQYFKGGRTENALVSLIDLAPTFLELGQASEFDEITGESLLPLLVRSDDNDNQKHREFVLTGRERHTHARPENFGYPARALRTERYLYIRNFKPDRWPAGNPPPENREDITDDPDLKSIGLGYNDIDASPSKELMIQRKDVYKELFGIGFNKRPGDELYDILTDPGCLQNLAEIPEYDSIRNSLWQKLESELKIQGDPRVLGRGDIFESYPRFGKMRNFTGFKERGTYNLKYSKNDQ